MTIARRVRPLVCSRARAHGLKPLHDELPKSLAESTTTSFFVAGSKLHMSMQPKWPGVHVHLGFGVVDGIIDLTIAGTDLVTLVFGSVWLSAALPTQMLHGKSAPVVHPAGVPVV